MKRIEFNYKILKIPLPKPLYVWICVGSNHRLRSVSKDYTQKHNAVNAVRREIRARKPGTASFEDLTGETNKIQRRLQGEAT